MFDFFTAFLGTAVGDYPFLIVAGGTMIGCVFFYMLFTIFAALFKIRK